MFLFLLIGLTLPATGGRRTARTKAESQRLFLANLAKGLTIQQSLDAIDRSMKSYEAWCKEPAFKATKDSLRSSNAKAKANEEEGFPPFAEFSEKYLGAKVWPHSQNMIDMIEGRDPAWLHPSMKYEAGNRRRVLINCPPFHAKSAALTINYVVYRIVRNPNIRVIIVSKTQDMAKKFLLAIKERLEDDQYQDMHIKYAPPGGYAANTESWSQSRIYINSDARDSGEKDPTVQALGIGGQIYGSRADLIILDDVVDSTNFSMYESQISWITSQVQNRVKRGQLVVVGTRLYPKDLYKELRVGTRYPKGKSPWTYLAMPAVLEYADDPADWVTLWPKADIPEVDSLEDELEPDSDGNYPMWGGPELSEVRDETPTRTWSLVYMQEDVTEDMIFHPDAVNGVVNGSRFAGPIPKDVPGSRGGKGMDGLVVVAGMDPAMVGFTAATVIGLDMLTNKRHVLDLHNKAHMTPDDIRDLFYSWTDRYGIVEWRVENNAFQSMLTQDREINQFLNTRGCQLVDHTTHAGNKWDPNFGVASLSTLFYGWDDPEGSRALIELPSKVNSEACKALIEQLTSWSPDPPKSQKTDLVMCLWFAELACRDRLRMWTGGRQTHVPSIFHTPYDLSRQWVGRLDGNQYVAYPTLAGV